MKFIESRNKFFIASLVFFAIGVLFMIVNSARGIGAFNYDIEFTGGTSFQIDFGKDVSNEEITQIVNDSLSIDKPLVQKILGTNQISIKMRSLTAEERIALSTAIKDEYGVSDADFNISDYSAIVSAEMQTKAILAVSVASIAILIYIGFRFKDLFTGASIVITILHDCFAVILAYAIFRTPLNYYFIAVLLTVLGYSINSTIVIFDRVRENRKIMNKPKPTHAELLNVSLKQTLTRSINTSFSTLLVVACLFIFGVPTLKDFSLPIMVGIVVGTYSSVCLTCSVWYMITGNAKKEAAKAA